MRRKVQMRMVEVQWNFWCGVEIVACERERERERRMGCICTSNIGCAFSASMLSKRYGAFRPEGNNVVDSLFFFLWFYFSFSLIFVFFLAIP